MIKAVPLEDRVAVCADTAYAAMKGRDAPEIKWSDGSRPDLNDDTDNAAFKEHLLRCLK